MSNLLEQAIIDANALKEVALKNAQNNLIEKYSKEFKETVEKLLEQEEVAAPIDSAPPAPEVAPLPDVAAAPMPQAGGEEPLKNVPSSFLDGDEDELITINFDEIKKQLTASLGAPIEAPTMDLTGPEDQVAPQEQPMMEELELEGEEELEEMHDAGGHYEQGDDALSGEDEDTVVININDEEDEEEFEFELEQEGAIENPEVSAAQTALDQANAKKLTAIGDTTKQVASAASKLNTVKAAAAAKQKAASPDTQSDVAGDEDFAITEEELSELAEELRVDLKPENQGRGYMGTTSTEKKAARNVELAAAQDEEAAKEREEEKKRLAHLQRENKALKMTIDEFKNILVSLKESQEAQQISNAKLLYTNKVLVNTSLNERQKENIVESISKSRSVQEAKTIYETLQSTVEGNASKKASSKSLSEALNRGPSPFMVRKPQSGGDESFQERMKLLAGIK